MSKPRTRGFTLIELLTVIAIIAILVGITAAVLPGVMERSKIVKTETTLKQLHTALSGYQVDNGSLPIGYGYIFPKRNPDDPAEPIVYNRTPYMARINFFTEPNLYDEFWAQSYDLNANGGIDILEFQPLGTKSGNRYIFDDVPVYTPVVPAPLAAQVAAMANEVPPYAYFPVNRAQADKLRAYCEADPTRQFADTADVQQFIFDNFTFPPPYFDDYVLISPGPAGKTFGVIVDNSKLFVDSGTDPGAPGHTYYINALRTFYLATRDYPVSAGQGGNGALDFDFRARTRGGEKTYTLPDGSFGAGPLIFHAGG